MNIRIIDSPKGRYFYSHIIPAIRNMKIDLKAKIVPLEELKGRNEVGLVCGEGIHQGIFEKNFLLIDKFVHETISYSFSQEDLSNILEELRCFQT
jgi:hypothetical protein